MIKTAQKCDEKKKGFRTYDYRMVGLPVSTNRKNKVKRKNNVMKEQIVLKRGTLVNNLIWQTTLTWYKGVLKVFCSMRVYDFLIQIRETSSAWLGREYKAKELIP